MQSINISIHVIAGLAAIVFGVFAYATQKGGIKHRQFGRLFLWLIGVVILTALVGVMFFRDRPFLTAVTMLAFYTSYSGFRVLKTKEKGFQLIDFGVMILVMGSAISYLVQINSADEPWNTGVVFYLLSYLFLIVGFDMIRFFFPNWISMKKFWLYEHIYKMTSSFSALISAGAGTVLVTWAPYHQIVPSVLTTLWLVFCLVYFPRKFFRT